MLMTSQLGTQISQSNMRFMYFDLARSLATITICDPAKVHFLEPNILFIHLLNAMTYSVILSVEVPKSLIKYHFEIF